MIIGITLIIGFELADRTKTATGTVAKFEQRLEATQEGSSRPKGYFSVTFEDGSHFVAEDVGYHTITALRENMQVGDQLTIIYEKWKGSGANRIYRVKHNGETYLLEDEVLFQHGLYCEDMICLGFLIIFFSQIAGALTFLIFNYIAYKLNAKKENSRQKGNPQEQISS